MPAGLRLLYMHPGHAIFREPSSSRKNLTPAGATGITKIKHLSMDRVFAVGPCHLLSQEIDNLFWGGEGMMKSTGIVRKVDDLGRVVIPIELRRNLGINEKDDAIEIYVDDDAIVLKKYVEPMTCQVTGIVSDDNIVLAGGNLILSKEGAEEILDELKEYLTASQS